MAALLTVGVINFNQGEYIAQCLDTIRSQTFKDFELYIIDDHSTDNSVELISTYINKHSLECQFIVNEVNQGICKNLNQLLHKAKGKYFTFIAADDWGTENRFEDMVHVLENADNDVCSVYSDCKLVNESGELIQSSYIKYFRPDLDNNNPPSGHIHEQLLAYNFIPAMATVTRTSSLVEVGGFDEELKFEDFDLWLKLSSKYRIIFSGNSFCYYRILGNSLIRRLGARKWEDMIRIYLKYAGRSKSSDDIIKPRILKSLENLYFEDSDHLEDFRCKVTRFYKPGLKFKFLLLAKQIGIRGSSFKKLTNKIFRRN